MSQKTTYTCDICGSTSEEKKMHSGITVQALPSYGDAIMSHTIPGPSTHVCDDCKTLIVLDLERVLIRWQKTKKKREKE